MTPWYIPLIGWWAGIGGRGLFQWDLPLGIVIGIFSIHWLVEVGWPIYSRGRLWRIRQSTTTNLLLLDFEANEVWKGDNRTSFWCDIIMRSFQNWKNILPIVFDFEKLGDTLESDISSGAATSFQHWVRGGEWAGEWSMLIGLCIIFYILDIEGMTKFILDMNFCMSVKWNEWHVERGCESLSPLRE